MKRSSTCLLRSYQIEGEILIKRVYEIRTQEKSRRLWPREASNIKSDETNNLTKHSKLWKYKIQTTSTPPS